MKTVIPEKIIHHCDRCKIQIEDSQIDCYGAADFVGRDFSGHAVGGYRHAFELCQTCALSLSLFLENK